MEIMTPDKIISLWQADDHRLIKPSLLPDTQWMLNAIFRQNAAGQLSLGVSEVKRLARDLFEHRKSINQPISRKQANQRVNRLLEKINELPNINAVLITTPVLAHRPTMLPNSGKAFSAAVKMVELDRKLLAWCRKTDTIEAWLLVFSIRLMTRLGMSESVMLGTLSQLTLRHINKTNKSINIPSSPDTSGHNDGHYRIILPDDVWVPLRAIITREKSCPKDAWLFAENDQSMTLVNKRRRQVLRQRLTRTSRLMLNDVNNAGETSYAQINSWQIITRSSRYVPILKGIPPVWSGLLRNYPLPTCTPIPLRRSQDNASHYAPGRQLGRLPDRQARRGPTHDKDEESSAGTQVPTTRTPGVIMIATDHLPSDWRRRIKNLLQKFLSETSLLSKKTVKAKKFDDAMQALLTKYESLINQLIGFTGHYPAWLLHFIYYQLRTEGNTISTAKTYLSRLTPITMLYHDAVLDVGDWDDEVVLEMEIAAKAGSHWAESTLEAFRSSFRIFIRFCQQHGILEYVTLPKRLHSLTPSTIRTRILSPDHMDTAWEELTKNMPTGSKNQMKALVIALGFYGGLRASEVESLTLNDIQIGREDEDGKSNCWVDILGGKTWAARRRVPLHVMAPPWVVKQLRSWVEERQQCFIDTSLKDIGLFGPSQSPDTYQRRYLITLAIDDMRYRLGEDIDFHGLRHAAVSWTLLRLHAAQNPGFADTLQHRHHWMFQPGVLQETLQYFCGAEGTDTLARGTVLLHVAKWIGHREPATMLENYAHTLGLIHGDILAPKSSKNRKIK